MTKQIPPMRSEAEVFLEGWLAAISVFERARKSALHYYGPNDPIYKVLAAVIPDHPRESGKFIAEALYPHYGPPPAEPKIPLEAKGMPND